MTTVMTSEQLSELIGLVQNEVRRSAETQMLSTSMLFDDAQKSFPTVLCLRSIS